MDQTQVKQLYGYLFENFRSVVDAFGKPLSNEHHDALERFIQNFTAQAGPPSLDILVPLYNELVKPLSNVQKNKLLTAVQLSGLVPAAAAGAPKRHLPKSKTAVQKAQEEVDRRQAAISAIAEEIKKNQTAAPIGPIGAQETKEENDALLDLQTKLSEANVELIKAKEFLINARRANAPRRDINKALSETIEALGTTGASVPGANTGADVEESEWLGGGYLPPDPDEYLLFTRSYLHNNFFN